MDIYIGGVRDRNTALNGDVVAALIKPPDEWKILYSLLDKFLDEHLDLKELVYKPIYSSDASALSDNSNIDKNASTNSSELCVMPNHNIPASDQEKVNDIKESQSNKIHKKKKRRGKKKHTVDLKETILQDEISTSINKSSYKDKSFDSNVVLPHQLESCESSDNESVDSVVIENEEILENDDEQDLLESSDKLILDCIHDKAIQDNPDNEEITKENISETNQNSTTEVSHIEREMSNLEVTDTNEKKVTTSPHSVPSAKIEKPKDEGNPNSKHLDKFKGKTNSKQLNKNKLLIENVMRLPDWERFVQRTASVIYLFKKVHSRLTAGILKPFPDDNKCMALFSPFDSRIPRLKIPMSQCPVTFLSRPDDFSKLILLAKVTFWGDPKYAFGELVRSIGIEGDINAEVESLLLENDIDFTEFAADVLKCLPSIPWTISQEEFTHRTDLRKSLIFTIDPSTARDLDDAVSCLPLPSGNFRVGVHIADVTHFVKANTPLDEVAAQRANSVYLPHAVIPMLPRLLCESLCSLNPGEDRLAFSVIWELTPEGKIIGEWFGRTIINSAIKMSYEHAQSMIDSELDDLSSTEYPQIHGRHKLKDIAKVVKNLYQISLRLRSKRFETGALRLDSTKLGFSLDEKTKLPNGIFVCEMKDSNRLIEEFMLLANISVAHKIKTQFQDLALLRRHPPPHPVALKATVNTLRDAGIYIDASSSKTLHESIQDYCQTGGAGALARMQMIVNLCSKPMQLAQYFCAGITNDSAGFHHYALNVPCYTHFTSPIRRYADIIVHRMLAASIDNKRYALPEYKLPIISEIAFNCNCKKKISKSVSEQSVDLFLALFIRNVREMTEDGIIINVLDRSVDILIPRLGVVKRCYMEKLPLTSMHFFEEKPHNRIVIEWKADSSISAPSTTQTLTIFEIVVVTLRPFENGALKYNAFLNRPSSVA